MKSIVLISLLVAASVGGQFALKSHRPGAAPAMTESAIAALGGLRSIAAEVLWFRVDRLRAECRYVELAQLANWLAFMEPHTPEVWSYSSWNLAYNISVMMPTFEDRWRWVLAGLKLLRDEGLRLNPREPEIYRELAWMFQIKLGGKIDDAAPIYRERWKAIVEDVAARGAWAELGMRPEEMAEVRTKYRFRSDWTNPVVSAVYWAHLGLRYVTDADDRERSFLMGIISQSLYTLAVQEGRVKPEGKGAS